MDTQKLAEILHSLKGEKTAAWLSRQIGISGQMMRHYLNGTGGIPGPENFQAIAVYMGITIDELTAMLGGKTVAKVCERPVTYNVFTANDAYKTCVIGLPKQEQLKLAKIIMNEAV